MQDHPHLHQMLQELAHYAAGGDVHPRVEQMAREIEHHAKGGEAYKYPQDDALEQARLNAIRLLGLHEHNTAHERARAMGFNTAPSKETYHGARGELQGEIDPSHSDLGFHTGTIEQATNRLKAFAPPGQDYPEEANTMPLLVSKYANLLKLKDTGSFHADAIASQLAKKKMISREKAKQIMQDIDSDYKQQSHYDNQMRRVLEQHGYHGGQYSNGQEGQGKSMVFTDPSQLRSRFAAFDPARAHEAGLNYADGGSVEPSYDEMLAHVMLHKADGGSIQQEPTEVGVDEAPDMAVKYYMSPDAHHHHRMPVGGVDMNPGQPGQQFAPPSPPMQQGQPPQGQPPQGMPPQGQPPQGQPPQGQPPPGPPSNILNMTRQGQAMSAMKAPPPVLNQPVKPAPSLLKNGMARMAEGGIVNDKHEKNRMEFLRGSHVPERVYHGTGNLENMESFDPEQTGKGNDQLGSGFYFTNKPETANGYTGSVSPSAPKGATKLGGDTSPGVIAAHLAIKKPLRVGPEGRHLGDAGVDMTHMQVKRIMNMAPNIKHRDKSPLADYVDTSRGISPAMIHEVAQHYTGPELHMLENDFFKNDPTAYREALHKVLGYDGVIKDFGNGEKHYVAWFPHQIKSAIGNRGTYDTNSDKITRKEGGSIKPVVRGIIKEKVTVIPNLDEMKLALMKAKR